MVRTKDQNLVEGRRSRSSSISVQPYSLSRANGSVAIIIETFRNMIINYNKRSIIYNESSCRKWPLLRSASAPISPEGEVLQVLYIMRNCKRKTRTRA